MPVDGAFGATTQISIDPDLYDAVWSRFVAPFVAGVERFCRARDLARLDELSSLVPTGATVFEVKGSTSMLLIETGSWAALAQRWNDGRCTITVRAATAELAGNAMAELESRVPVYEPPPESVIVDFWQNSRNDIQAVERTIESPAWTDLTQHYPPPVSSDLGELVENPLTAPEGRIILWHGPPGTGKTTAIRMLAGEWHGRARLQVVLDPELIFSSSAHMMQVLLHDDGSDGKQWRVLVIEDADDLVRQGGNSRALSRLLNLGDGIVGQGMRVLLLLTTNEPPDRLHPALGRPGRCLMHTEFRPFTRSEAVVSFGSDVPDRAHLTLAEILNERSPVTTTAPGQYL